MTDERERLRERATTALLYPGAEDRPHSEREAEEWAAALAHDRPSGPVGLDWHLRNLLRGTDDPANWGVPEDYAAGWIAAIHAVQELAVRLTEAKPEAPA
jgi:hypothetical protein